MQHLGDDGTLHVVCPIPGEMLYLHRMPATGTATTVELAETGESNVFYTFNEIWLNDRTILLRSNCWLNGGFSSLGARLIHMQLP